MDIYINLNVFSSNNSTSLIGDFGTTLESLFKKKSDKYDIIFFDNVYPIRFGPYLLDFKKVFPEEHIALYSSGVASKTCIYEDKWVGFVNILISIFYTFFFKKKNKNKNKYIYLIVNLSNDFFSIYFDNNNYYYKILLNMLACPS